MHTEKSARSARCNGIAAGIRPRPGRKTRADEIRETDVKFGLIKQVGR